ncbi:MAG TPA: hypothetical protein VFT18_03780 [Gaiellaceae bacterium]|nr:hypothetical protein [Gaiellaceae bacterium]
MQRAAALLALLASALTITGGASAALRVGVADDFGTNADQTTWFFDHLGELGMTENRVSVNFDAANPTTIQQQALLDLYVPFATLRGVRVVFSVAPTRAKAITETPGAVGAYAAYVALLAQTYPTVKDFIIGNEPNQPRFWQPQFGSAGENVSSSSYFSLLAASYDALKAVDPSIRVIGLGLSPRGGDRPGAADNVSTSPVRFLNGLGKAYRASGRKQPLMDELAFHPYPDQDRDPLLKGYRWPNAGIPNLGRVKQAVWDAFRGTAQPTFPEGTSSAGLAFRLDEVGWQVGVEPAAAGAYHGRENIRPTDEGAQARIYGEALRYLACDASVGSVLFFLLRDEPDLDRWQAGLVRADGSRRPSFDAVKSTLAETGGRCQGSMRAWRHSTRVEGAKVKWPRQRRLPARRLTLAAVANAEEDARVEAVLVNARGRRVLRQAGVVDAYRSRIMRFTTRFRPGRYTLRVTFRAAMNPTRESSFSAPLRITR